ncbi:MAG TPA: bacterial proteasome activator family protein [Jatrophihabitans sp.]|nr:bacterial proteasome activator family protein [Jatrophihabitans sp.]
MTEPDRTTLPSIEDAALLAQVSRYLGQDVQMSEEQSRFDDARHGDAEDVVVMGQADGSPDGREPDGDESDGPQDVMSQVEQPAKVMRIGTMIKQLLEEVRAAPLDEAGRVRLREIHQSSIKELEDGLAPELRDELSRLSLPFSEETVPSEAELRIAQAQLVGWLEGLFHGIQTALFAQQMAARAQLEQMRGRALPGQVVPGQVIAGMPGRPGFEPAGEHGTGQYL